MAFCSIQKSIAVGRVRQNAGVGRKGNPVPVTRDQAVDAVADGPRHDPEHEQQRPRAPKVVENLAGSTGRDKNLLLGSAGIIDPHHAVRPGKGRMPSDHAAAERSLQRRELQRALAVMAQHELHG